VEPLVFGCWTKGTVPRNRARKSGLVGGVVRKD
jgi:hypothetical protein